MTSILTDSILICFENPQESSRIVENPYECRGARASSAPPNCRLQKTKQSMDLDVGDVTGAGDAGDALSHQYFSRKRSKKKKVDCTGNGFRFLCFIISSFLSRNDSLHCPPIEFEFIQFIPTPIVECRSKLANGQKVDNQSTQPMSL